MQNKKRERSVKHRQHDAGGKTDGKSNFFGKFRGKAWFQKFLFSRSKTGNFIFFAGILENFKEGPNQAMVFLSSFWFFGGFRSSRFHFENNLKIMRFHLLLLISMLFVWFRYYCCSYFRLCDDDDGFPICGSMQHIAVDVSLRTHIRVIVEVWLGFLCLRG